MDDGIRLRESVSSLQEEFQQPFKSVLDVRIDEMDRLLFESSLNQIINCINDLTSSTKSGIIHQNENCSIGTQTDAPMTSAEQMKARQIFTRLCSERVKDVEIVKMGQKRLNQKYKEFVECKDEDEFIFKLNEYFQEPFRECFHILEHKQYQTTIDNLTVAKNLRKIAEGINSSIIRSSIGYHKKNVTIPVPKIESEEVITSDTPKSSRSRSKMDKSVAISQSRSPSPARSDYAPSPNPMDWGLDNHDDDADSIPDKIGADAPKSKKKKQETPAAPNPKKELDEYVKKFYELKMAVGPKDLEKMTKRHDFSARCPKCHKKFDKEWQLVHHAPCQYKCGDKSKEYTCPVCQMTGLKDKIKCHLMYHFEPKIECLVCNKKFHSNNRVKYHIQTRHTDDRKPYKCIWPGCSKDFSHKNLVTTHIVVQHMEKNPNECKICGLFFKRPDYLSRHNLRVHNRTQKEPNEKIMGKRIKCPHPPCHRLFSHISYHGDIRDVNAIKLHMRNRHPDVPFDPEDFFRKNYKTKTKKSKGVKKRVAKKKIDTSGAKPVLVEADNNKDEDTEVEDNIPTDGDVPKETREVKTSNESEFSFETTEEMEAYAEQFLERKKVVKWSDYKHMWKFSPFSGTCSMCHKSFDSKVELVVHKPCYGTKMGIIGTIRRDNPVPCSVCSKTFNTLWEVKDHMNYHMDPQLECVMCGQKSHSRHTAQRHSDIHLGTKPVSCKWEGCTLRFERRKIALKHVIKSHLKLTKYKCDLCEETWPFLDDMIQHKRRVHEEKPYKCLVEGCDEMFYGSSQRTTHIKRFHKSFDLNAKDVQEKIKDEIQRLKILKTNGVSGRIEVLNGEAIVTKKPLIRVEKTPQIQRVKRKFTQKKVDQMPQRNNKKSKSSAHASYARTTVEVADDTNDGIASNETSVAIESIPDAHVVPEHQFEPSPAPTLQDMYNSYQQQFISPFNVHMSQTPHYMTQNNPIDYASDVNGSQYNLRRSTPRHQNHINTPSTSSSYFHYNH